MTLCSLEIILMGLQNFMAITAATTNCYSSSDNSQFVMTYMPDQTNCCWLPP
jgi:hypothetical protein